MREKTAEGGRGGEGREGKGRGEEREGRGGRGGEGGEGWEGRGETVTPTYIPHFHPTLTDNDIGESVAPVVYPEEASDTTDHLLPLSPCISDLKDKFNQDKARSGGGSTGEWRLELDMVRVREGWDTFRVTRIVSTTRLAKNKDYINLLPQESDDGELLL